jgi:hypothetical protein
MTWLENLRIQTKQKTKEVKDLRSVFERLPMRKFPTLYLLESRIYPNSSTPPRHDIVYETLDVEFGSLFNYRPQEPCKALFYGRVLTINFQPSSVSCARSDMFIKIFLFCILNYL